MRITKYHLSSGYVARSVILYGLMCRHVQYAYVLTLIMRMLFFNK